VRLNSLPPRTCASITAIDWAQLGDRDGRRLRDLGFDIGMMIETLHRGFWGQDPMACRIGRMTIAIRRVHAAAIEVTVP
jgi:ferrous iron transport protein A